MCFQEIMRRQCLIETTVKQKAKDQRVLTSWLKLVGEREVSGSSETLSIQGMFGQGSQATSTMNFTNCTQHWKKTCTGSSHRPRLRNKAHPSLSFLISPPAVSAFSRVPCVWEAGLLLVMEVDNGGGTDEILYA